MWLCILSMQGKSDYKMLLSIWHENVFYSGVKCKYTNAKDGYEKKKKITKHIKYIMHYGDNFTLHTMHTTVKLNCNLFFDRSFIVHEKGRKFSRGLETWRFNYLLQFRVIIVCDINDCIVWHMIWEW